MLFISTMHLKMIHLFILSWSEFHTFHFRRLFIFISYYELVTMACYFFGNRLCEGGELLDRILAK